MKKLSLLLFSIILIAGCASMANQRSLKGLPVYDFSVEIPNGWWKPEHINKYLVTKDGAFQQYVLIQQRPIDRPFRHTQKTLKKGMLPQETAGIIVDEIASDHNITNFEILKNAPAVIDGHEGFEILFVYKNRKGTPFKTLYYGFVSETSFFSIRYNAAAGGYFEKDMADFKKILTSFKLAT
jgi:hypothetical protein